MLLIQQEKAKEDEDTIEEEIKIDTLNDERNKPIKHKSSKDSSKKSVAFVNVAILTDERKNNLNKKPVKA